MVMMLYDTNTYWCYLGLHASEKEPHMPQLQLLHTPAPMQHEIEDEETKA